MSTWGILIGIISIIVNLVFTLFILMVLTGSLVTSSGIIVICVISSLFLKTSGYPSSHRPEMLSLILLHLLQVSLGKYWFKVLSFLHLFLEVLIIAIRIILLYNIGLHIKLIFPCLRLISISS